MMELTGNVKLRYFAPLDRFLRIRALAADDIPKLVGGIQFRDRRAYVQFIINTLIVDYNDVVLPDLMGAGFSPQRLIEREEQLFRLGVDVNPGLHLEAVGQHLSAPEAAPLVLLEGPAAEGGPHAAPVAREALLGLEEQLRARIVGQDEAVRVVADAVRKAYVGFRDEERPVGNFLFVGPTGVGKTELAKTLARCLFPDAPGLVRIDCSEFAQAHEYAKLIGSPPGYVGHDEGGQLTEALRRRPHVVVLFDEIEKADAKVHDLLLQILDDGLLTDSKGHGVSFRNAIIVLTSNVGTRELMDLDRATGFHDGPADERERVRTSHRAIERFFRPEFLNRIDEVILFRGFTRDEARRIVDLMLDEVARRLHRHGITILFSDEVRELLVERGISKRHGARPLRRAIKKLVEGPLASFVLAAGFAGGTIEARVQGDSLAFA